MPKPVVLCPWKRDARERRLAELRALEARASAKEPVLYADEVDVHLNPKIGRDWMLPGQQRRIVTPGKNQKFYLAGALDVGSGNYGIHSARTTKRRLAALGGRIVLHFLPPYCPDAHGIDHAGPARQLPCLPQRLRLAPRYRHGPYNQAGSVMLYANPAR